jgi:hypothetical protein
MEKTLLELMYEVPSSDIVGIEVDRDNLDQPDTILAQARRRRTA